MGAATDHRPEQYERHRPEESVLYRTIASHLETFLATRITEGNALPSRVEKELRAYLRCGILQYGFTRTACPTCAFERIVAFSCKGRGFCPSCGGKRMAETAAHLIDDVLPWLPYRQWVVTLPISLRFWCARSPQLTSAVHGIIKEEIARHQTSGARAAGVQDPLPGGITFIQRSGSALNINVHYHVLALDGVYAPPTRSDGKPRFHRLPPPTDDDVAAVVEKIANRTVALLRKRGYLDAGAEEVPRPDVAEMFAEHPAAEAGLAASVKGRIAFGPRAGQRVRRIGKGFGYEEEVALVVGVKCATVNGFNLHAQVHVGGHQRDRLEQLVKYLSRPPLALDRLAMRDDGDLTYTLKKPWSDGTQAILLSPGELLEKLAALVPPRKSHLTRHWGVFSSHSKWRKAIVLNPTARKGFNPETVDPTKVKNHLWAKMLARMFKIDVGHCPRCGDEMKIVGVVMDPAGVRRYLRSIGLSEHPPPIAPARDIQGELEYPPEESCSAPQSSIGRLSADASPVDDALQGDH